MTRRSTAPADTRWWVLAVAVCAVVGLLLGTTRHVSDGAELRGGDTTRLADLVDAAQSSSVEAERSRDTLEQQVDTIQQRTASVDTDVADALARIDSLADAAGREAASGGGVTVTMADAPRGPDGSYASDASVDDLVVHQVDVQSVLNALWAGGASAIAMQDQRLVASSAPRCIGNTLLLGGRTYSPPYVMTAIGDSDRLRSALKNEPGVRLYEQYALRYGLRYDVAVSEDLSVPAYSESVRMRYAQPR
ncbi:hypothetical protein CH256_23510 [Rhodococcus sp. 05-2254-6]|uniref:DUF881 domain-containing protein n=1 Tax=Rhodococcus sp. 05-2254-6 TaxID=2022489 RepID=UPI000B9BA660|nr:DUF881 domain-containing protein [Rhodococcus sp. 05-2254-6]OZE21005.1 hypothetical protein CH256_23510 [Rhodococcus sp. 05-2254-6]